MTLARFKRPVVELDEDATVVAAARAMRDQHVGCVLVTRGGHPLGLVTDRDLVVRSLAEGRDPSARLRECVTYDPFTLSEKDGVDQAVSLMRDHGVRRVPIVDDQGRAVGVVTADDLFAELGQRLGGLCEGIANNYDASETR
jgi:CBS domain-containing protein